MHREYAYSDRTRRRCPAWYGAECDGVDAVVTSSNLPDRIDRHRDELPGFDQPRSGEHATDSSLAVMLATTRTPRRVSPFVVEVRAGGPVAHAHVTQSGVIAHAGAAHHPDLTVSGTGLRQALAQPNHLHDLIAEGLITAEERPTVLDSFAQAFYAPLGKSDG